ncbi:SCO4225 family membrane protein [Streptomyces sp. NPDC048201]|uniref:SCO4225 family membrane protein n=1 Tax=Streptomyces sp. NPDC048201 TaxID=3365513 RepID=UPI00371591FE
MPNPSRPRRLSALATGHWPARVGLAVVAFSALAMFLFPAAGFARILLLLTAPLSLLPMSLPFGPGSGADTTAGVLAEGVWVALPLVCALVTAAVLRHLAARPAAPAPESLPQRDSDRAQPASSRMRRLRTLLAPAVDNWLSRGYLAVVAAALTYFLGDTFLGPDSGYAAAYPVITTAPLGILVLVVSIPTEFFPVAWVHPMVLSAGTIAAALFNAVHIGRYVHTQRAGER